MKTSQEWWDEVKADNDKLVHWLKNQYHGEAIAAQRIDLYILPHIGEKYQFMVAKISQDEEKHASWIKELLDARGIEAKILDKEERYWKTVMTEDFTSDGNYAAGVAAHAEEMRLERIKVIMSDNNAPKDIQNTFKNIYLDEVFHAKAFKLIAGDEYYNAAAENHAKGLEALGLIV